MEEQIIIAEAEKEDYEKLKAVFYEVRRERFTWMAPEEIRLEDFDSCVEGEKIFLARKGGQTAGFISIWEPDKFIHNLFVEKEYRGLHVGTLLLEEALKRYGTPLTLKCVKENRQALMYYLHYGFEIVEEKVSEGTAYYLMKYEKEKSSR